jgi:pimeloyl-ACP methyl ester carboxylesterase
MLSLPSTTKGSGPGLLLVHGIGATSQSTYGLLVPGLAEDFAVVAADYSGVRGEELSLDKLVDAHLAVADGVGLDRFAMVGHSFGVPIALRLALRHPERVSALVLTAGFAHAPTSTRLKLKIWRSMAERDVELLPRFLMSVMFSERYLASMTDGQLDGMAELIALGLGDGDSSQTDLVAALDLRADLAWVTAPTLVVSATADQLVPRSAAEALARSIPGARLVDLDCGHHPALECPSEWLGLVTDFLGSAG